MDPRDCSVIDRHFPRLQQCLEPTKLLRHLETVGVLDEDDVETIREEKTKTSRENQVAVFVGILKRREHGFRNFLQALLKSKVQDFLARELLEDDVYDEEEISSILAELENDLDETQSLKLSLIEEQKRHKNTKQELEEIRRSSLIFSDSSSSGLFADYDSAPSDENEFVDYSPREEIENGSSQDEGHSSLFGPMQDAFQNSEPLTARNDDLEWEHEDGWRKFGSVDNLDTLSRRKSKRGSLLKLRKTSSLGRLNDCVRKKHDSEVRCRSGSGGKWSSEENLKQNNESSGSLNRRTRDQPDKSISLENKVALLQKQLQEEHQKRLMSENEVAKLQIEKENLNEELEDTRDQLRLSHLNLYCQDDDYEDELYFDQADDPGDFREPYNKTATLEGKMRFSPTDSDQAAACCSSPDLLSQTERMRTTRLTESWRKVNSQFYELDEYDNEIEVELDPRNIMDALRRLKTYTNCLYNDILYERDELQYLKKRASRLENK